MITQEMVEVACIAFNEVFCRQPDDSKNAPEAQKKALTAVYPLILEQAAGVCDNWRKIKREDNVYYENAGDKETAVVCLVQASMAASCAASIRNLKDKTDEAHNG